ncbi:class I SAM-dependent methyltransferase [Fluviicola sp. SGL-29]|nr:class I SAM-dependent methyltransferase [Fluviicola sp. SGL-29]
MQVKHDPIGAAILDFAATGTSQDIVVASDLCEDDVIASGYLFRSRKEMPVLEKKALDRCAGKVLDVGAGAGSHAKILKEKGLDVTALEPSEGAVQYMHSIGLTTIQGTIQEHTNATYDTLLLLMNGVGLAGKLEQLESFLEHAKLLLNPGGKIICDSTDIQYLYEEEDGSMWMDLNAEYYGNFKFQMTYKDHQTEWFDWLYVDFIRLKNAAEKTGFSVELLFEQDDHYLVELTRL